MKNQLLVKNATVQFKQEDYTVDIYGNIDQGVATITGFDAYDYDMNVVSYNESMSRSVLWAAYEVLAENETITEVCLCEKQ